jgi:hypothetical protein
VPRRLTTLLAGALLAVPMLAAAGTAAAAPASTTAAAAGAGASKVPSLVRSQITKIRQAMGQRGATTLSARQASALSGGFLPVRTDGGIDLQLHALGPVGAAQAAQLRALGATVLASSADFARVPGVALPDSGLIHAVVPYDRVDAVAGLSWVAAVRPTIRPAVDVGDITSEGVTLHNATAAQALGFTGAGQKIGAISDGTTSIAQAIARGELPNTVQVLDAGEGDEGTAMLEILHDMAPGAQLAFNTVGADLTGYVAAFHNLAAAGSTLITEDLAFDDEPAFQQGLGATTAEQLAQHGIWVSSSAGNLGAKHATRAPATGTGTTPDGVTSSFAHCPGAPDNTVKLRGADNTYDVIIRPGGAILPTLQWSEPRAIFPTPGQGGFTDLNLYLMTGDGKDCLAVSNAVQANGVGDTIEQLLFENPTDTPIPAKLVVDVAGTSSATQPPRFDLRWRTALVTTVDPTDRAGSLNPDSNYLGFATSAGAAGANVSTDPATVPLEPYSAAGPVQIGLTTRCAAGAAGPCEGRPGGGFVSFPAPNWAGADGVSVSGVGGFGSGTCPALVQGDCRFFGTSAAAPSAAGVAALVLQQNGGRLAPRDLNSIMSDLAYPRAGIGWGAGVLRAIR